MAVCKQVLCRFMTRGQTSEAKKESNFGVMCVTIIFARQDATYKVLKVSVCLFQGLELPRFLRRIQTSPGNP